MTWSSELQTTIQELVGRVHRVLAARRDGKEPLEEDLAEGDPTKDKLVTKEIRLFRERQAQRDLEKKDRRDDGHDDREQGETKGLPRGGSSPTHPSEQVPSNDDTVSQ